MSTFKLTSETFEELTSQGITLISFHTDWCQYCPAMTKILEEISVELCQITCVLCDADAEPSITNQYLVTSFTTLILMRDGENIGKYEGGQNKQAVLKWLESFQLRELE